MTAIRLFLAALLCLPLSCSRERSAERYNLLLITVDTIRADRVGVYGDSAAKTPVMDRVAREGVRFQNAISAVPLTLPSHATILTGLLPPQHGLRNNGAGKLSTDIPTLASTLSAAGYRTGAFVGAFVLDRRFGLNRGFDWYDDEIAAARLETASLEAERPAGHVVDRALQWMRQADARPMFGWVHLYDPHAPYAPPEPFRTSFAEDPYRGEVAYVDAQIGRLLDELDRLKLADRTVVVIVGDHGEALGEHGEGTHGLLLYEPTLRVPLIMRAPAVLKPAVVERPVSLGALAATLKSLLALEEAGEHDLIGGRPEVIYAETEYPTLFGWGGLASTRSEGWKFIDAPSRELYDLATDPGETRNLYGQERRPMHRLAEALRITRAGAAQQAPVQLDPETQRKLASLGYVAPSGPISPATRVNPVQMVGLFRRFEQSIRDLSGGRSGKAITELEELVHADPDNPVFRSSLARALRQQGKIERAIELYRDAVALRPNDAEGWYNLASAFQESGDQTRAAEAARESIRRDPSRPEAHNILGITYSAEGKFQEALAQFREATELDPRNARAYNNSGNVLRSMKRFDEAESAYRRAIELDGAYSDPWNGLGTLEVDRGHPESAIQFFERALTLAPDAHEVKLNRAVAYQLAGDVQSAIREYRAFIEAVKDKKAFTAQRRAAQVMLGRLSRS